MILRAEHLLKIYKGRSVVNDISVQVSQGEIVGLLGPNGAGKTTSFYMIVGLIQPNSGNIFLEDQDITGLPMYKRAKLGIGYLAQEASVFRKLSVEENILAVLEMTTLTKAQADSFLAEQLKPQALEAACRAAGHPLQLHRHPGYDHSYYFIASFIEAHLHHHAAALLP